MAPIDNALAAIESLERGESFLYREVARRFGVSNSTLTRRHKGRQRPREAKDCDQQRLSPQQERELVQHINGLTEVRLPPTREMIRYSASSIATEPVSDAWVTRFLGRHGDQLVSRWTTAMDANRLKADLKEKYEAYFKLLHGKMAEYGIEPRHTYNMDEKGFMLGVLGRSKRVFSRRSYEKKEVTAALQDSSRN